MVIQSNENKRIFLSFANYINTKCRGLLLTNNTGHRIHGKIPIEILVKGRHLLTMTSNIVWAQIRADRLFKVMRSI